MNNNDGGFFDAARGEVISVSRMLQFPDLSADITVYHIQQAAEKMIKHILNINGIIPEKTHQIEPLLREARERRFLELSDDEICEVSDLSAYATDPSYPSERSRIIIEDVMKAVTLYNKLARCLERNGYPALYISD